MNIFKCDRCKEVQSDLQKPSGTIQTTKGSEIDDLLDSRHIELCYKCYNNFIKWIGKDKMKPVDC